jgi:cytoskeletal protein CcmA (bactofilin family)
MGSMGLFGRDDRPPRAANSTPSRPARTETGQPLSGDGDRTVIAPSIRIEGTLTCTGEVLVNGMVSGTIEGSGLIRVAPRGEISASIHGRAVVIAGTVRGDITADERIELEPTAKVEGDITAPRILIKDGATFRGQVNMRQPVARAETAPTAEPPTPPQTAKP